MKKATAIAPANIAFIKFFGKTDEALRLPANSSISMCLSNAFTTTTVEFSPVYKKDSIEIKGEKFKENEEKRIIDHLERIRKLAKFNLHAKVVTQNNFPKSSGIASSASGFAALTLAATYASGLKLSEKQLSILARLASGSACRSIPSGFVEWKRGRCQRNTHGRCISFTPEILSNETSYAYSLYPPDYWDILDILVIMEEDVKAISTTDAHELAAISPFMEKRLVDMDDKIVKLKQAMRAKDFNSFGQITESETLNMHAVMMTTTPPLFYWKNSTIEIMLAVWSWRRNGLSVYFTIDAGPNLHLLCEKKNEKQMVFYLKKMKNIKRIIVNKPSFGARLSNKHLF